MSTERLRCLRTAQTKCREQHNSGPVCRGSGAALLQTPISGIWARLTPSEAKAQPPMLGLPCCNSPFPKLGSQSSRKSLNRIRVSQARARDAPSHSAHQPPPWMSQGLGGIYFLIPGVPRRQWLPGPQDKSRTHLCAVSVTAQVFHPVP